MPNRVHHSAICVADIDASLRFYRDGLGLEVLMDHEFDGDWSTLFRARSKRLRSIMLGDPADGDAGIVELVSFPDGVESMAPTAAPTRGFFLLSFFVDVDEVVARLQDLGYPKESSITVPSPRGEVPMVTVRDPDGVLVELIGVG